MWQQSQPVSSLSPLCRSYQTMLNSFLVFYHLLVGFTEKQSTNSNGGFCVKQEKILCPKTWTKQTAFSCFSKHAASLFHCSHSFSSRVAPPTLLAHPISCHAITTVSQGMLCREESEMSRVLCKQASAEPQTEARSRGLFPRGQLSLLTSPCRNQQ